MTKAYDRLTGRYDTMHARWLQHAAGEAQAALEAGIISRIQANHQVLDAGCGTGKLAQMLTRQVSVPFNLTLLDSSQAMLERARNPNVECVQGSLLNLPFEDATFDLSIAAWSIETTENHARAIEELMRVTKPGGHVICAFCASEPPVWVSARLLRKGILLRNTGRFLNAGMIETEFDASGASHVIRHRCRGPVAVIDAQRAFSDAIRRAA